jgi:hypothetical protein
MMTIPVVVLIRQKPGLLIPGATNVRILPENIKHGKMVLV